MIASLDGTVGAVSADSLVVEVGGVGYRVFCAPSLLASAVPGARLKVHTFHLVREDQQALYGFASAGELGFFTLLLTVQGVGPKVALAIVGSRPIGDLQLAIVQDDQAVLVSVPGVGRRLAGRICLELKEKVEAAGIAAAGSAGPSAAPDVARETEVVAALQALGYSVAEARAAARLGARKVAEGASLEDRVKAALTASAVD
jgi:holliday junction DNA helicase RuvA